MKINIVKPVLPHINEIQDKFQQCLSSGMVTNNSHYLRSYEEALKEYFRSPQTPVCYCNGELALHGLIQAWKTKLGYGVHDTFDVLVPSFTFSGTINALVSNNLKPVFCDINNTLTMDFSKLDNVNDNVKMLLPVGVYGNLPDIEKAKAFSEAHGMALLFDNAPAFGATYKGHPPAYYKIEEIYSFHATKIYNSMEGGAALTHDKEIHSLLSRIRDFGQYEKNIGDVDVPGLNAKMQEISAIVGLKNLENFEHILSKRIQNIQHYNTFFNALKNKGYLDVMHVNEDVFCPYLYFPIILNEEATKFIEHLKDHDISARRYYTSVHTLKYYKNKYQSLHLDYTNSIKDRIVALPIHSIMEQAEINHLFSVIDKYFKH